MLPKGNFLKQEYDDCYEDDESDIPNDSEVNDLFDKIELNSCLTKPSKHLEEQKIQRDISTES